MLESRKTPSPAIVIKFLEIFDLSMDDLMGIKKPVGEKTINVDGLTEEEIKVVQIMVDILRNRKE